MGLPYSGVHLKAGCASATPPGRHAFATRSGGGQATPATTRQQALRPVTRSANATHKHPPSSHLLIPLFAPSHAPLHLLSRIGHLLLLLLLPPLLPPNPLLKRPRLDLRRLPALARHRVLVRHHQPLDCSQRSGRGQHRRMREGRAAGLTEVIVGPGLVIRVVVGIAIRKEVRLDLDPSVCKWRTEQASVADKHYAAHILPNSPGNADTLGTLCSN